MTAADFRLKARQALQGHWGMAVLITFVALLLGGTYGSPDTDYSTQIDNYWGSGGSYEYTIVETEDGVYVEGNPPPYDYIYETENGFMLGSNPPQETWVQSSPVELKFRPAWLGFLLDVVLGPLFFTTALLYSIFVFFLGGAVELGLKSYFINLSLGREQQPWRTLFSHFQHFGTALGLRLLTWVLIFLWSLLLVIPGIIASYRYALAPYLLAQDPELGALGAIQESTKLMDGHKWRLFCLEFSFIGWALLSALTFGLGSFLLNPYIEAAKSAFYLERTGQLGDDGADGGNDGTGIEIYA